jgi:steroid 5-alpha reductase family enzyme
MEQEKSDPEPQPTPLSFLKFLAILAVALPVFFACLAAFLVLSDRPYAIQVGTFLLYSVLVFLHTFLRSRTGPGYSLRMEAVRRKLPPLAVIHAAFSAVIFSVQTAVLNSWSHLPAFWTKVHGPKHDSWLSGIAIALWAVAILFEGDILRGILERSCTAVESQSGKAA